MKAATFWRWLCRERTMCSLCYAEGKRTILGSNAEARRMGPRGQGAYASRLRLRLIAHVRVNHPDMREIVQ